MKTTFRSAAVAGRLCMPDAGLSVNRAQSSDPSARSPRIMSSYAERQYNEINRTGGLIMDRNEIFERIKDIVIDQLGVEDPDKIQMDTSMTKDLEALFTLVMPNYFIILSVFTLL